jgi:hypothetical protein
MHNTGSSSIPDTRVSSIVCFAILVLPVLLDEEYWSFQYCVLYNTSITSIVCFTILVLPVLKAHNTGSSSILHPAILVILVLQNTQYWKL